MLKYILINSVGVICLVIGLVMILINKQKNDVQNIFGLIFAGAGVFVLFLYNTMYFSANAKK